MTYQYIVQYMFSLIKFLEWTNNFVDTLSDCNKSIG
jgi:hypothetical protein